MCRPASSAASAAPKRQFGAYAPLCRRIAPTDARIITDMGREIADEYAQLRDSYQTPKHPIVLAHGLLGFAELKLAGSYLPSISYWRGIKDALSANRAEVITASVPPSGSIEKRAAKLAADIEAQAKGKSVNIIAHSMGGLDARYMISQLQPASVDVKSLTTVSTPHHGSSFADYLIDAIGPNYLPRLYAAWEQATGWEPGAFAELTTRYMSDEFIPKTPDDPTVRYFSYGAMVRHRPPLLSPFRFAHRLIKEREGPNDGLVSVESSKWGTYKGTLVGVNHLDLINWSNRLRFTAQRLMGHPPSFNAVAFYLDIGEMLSKEGL
ncbi:triacylglycerol lipase-like protein [Parathielavia hyrcaniae]|uniref:Triacylglycerol lipase-like protein n=1 Tax=Parathielavia hyrcaniae TaxID=113614 RepID=A0AAN6T0Z4_9PEZI|nr:triacylglycerol lipase-like protein [Parathielavia hyrcaniae]